MYKSNSHFSLRHYEGAVSGPFSFLNPTTRRSPISFKSTTGTLSGTSQGSEHDEEISDESRAENKSPYDEMLASAVEQKWRSRDNRKGKKQYHGHDEPILIL